MGLTATARLGRPPHPSIALIDINWLEDGLEEEETALSYIRLLADGASLGVLQVLDSRVRSQEEVYLDPRAWLSRVPDPGTTLELEAVGKVEYAEWRKVHTIPRRQRFWVSLWLTVLAGIIELFWNVGKYWDCFIRTISGQGSPRLPNGRFSLLALPALPRTGITARSSSVSHRPVLDLPLVA